MNQFMYHITGIYQKMKTLDKP